MTIDDDNNDDSNDKVGRNVNVNDDDATNAMAIPARRNATDDGMTAMAATPAGTTTTPAVPITRCVQFCDQPVRQLVHKLKALDISQDTTSDSESEEPKELVDLAFDHETKLLCFTTEISSDPGLPKMLKEALAGRDTNKWREAMANKIMNFLKQNAWKKVPMSQVHRERRMAIPTKLVFKIKDKQDGLKWYKAHIMTKGF